MKKAITLHDRELIADLISSYSHAWDSKDAKRSVSVFTDDAIFQTYLAGELVSEVRSNDDRLEEATQRHRTFIEKGIQTRHLQNNTILTMKPDGSIHGETIFWVSWQYENEASPKLMHTGVYLDRFVKTSMGWRFARREVHVDHK